jgi:hypothetical protein
LSDDGSTGWADISGATSATYTPVSGDEDKYVRLQVTATNSNGSSLPAYSAASDQIEVPAFPSGAVAFWKLADLTDASGNGNTLTNNNTVTFAAGKIGNAAVFDGVDQYFSGPNLLTVSIWSLSAWLKTSASGYKILFKVETLSGGSQQTMLQLGDGDVRAFCGNGNEQGTFWGVSANDDAWHHVVLIADTVAGEMKCYFDGSLVRTETSADVVANQNFCIGSIDGTYDFWDGSIDAFGIWNRALSAPEIATLYNSGTGLEPA